MPRALRPKAVAPLRVDRSIGGKAAPGAARPGARLLLASLLLNGGLALGGVSAALVLQSQLDALASRARESAQVIEGTAQGLTTLGAQSRELADGLVDVRKALSSRSSEDLLFFKALILKPGLDHALARRVAAAVERESAAQGQDPNLVLAIISIESGFNTRAISSEGAVGLMQVMPLWREALGVQDLSEPEGSIHAGTRILAQYRKMYRDLDLAVSAYNLGPTAVDQALGSGERPTNGYAEKVFGLRQRLERIDRSAQRVRSEIARSR